MKMPPQNETRTNLMIKWTLSIVVEPMVQTLWLKLFKVWVKNVYCKQQTWNWRLIRKQNSLMIGHSISEFFWTIKLFRKLHSLSIVGISYNLTKTTRGTHPWKLRLYSWKIFKKPDMNLLFQNNLNEFQFSAKW